MPIFNLTIPDSSPLILYSGLWNDTQPYSTFDYIDGKYHGTGDNSATATLRFFGSGIYVYGTQRPDHGTYKVTFDGVVSIGNAYADAVAVHSLLFSAGDFEETAAHELTLQNYAIDPTKPSTVDIDSIILTTGDGNLQTRSAEMVWDDGHPNITYVGGWHTPTSLAEYYHNMTLHVACVAGAAAYISFVGNAVQVYGATSTNHGLFYAIMDGGAPLILNGYAPQFRAQMLLFYASHLSDGLHNLTIANIFPGCTDLDKIVISRWPSDMSLGESQTASSLARSTQFSSSSSPTQRPTSNTSPSKPASHLHAGTIAGFVSAAGVSIVLLGLTLILYIRRRRRSSQTIYPFPSEARPVTTGYRNSKLRMTNDTARP